MFLLKALNLDGLRVTLRVALMGHSRESEMGLLRAESLDGYWMASLMAWHWVELMGHLMEAEIKWKQAVSLDG